MEYFFTQSLATKYIVVTIYKHTDSVKKYAEKTQFFVKAYRYRSNKVESTYGI
jgi:hypothetical protein